jgi:hypothetical protein
MQCYRLRVVTMAHSRPRIKRKEIQPDKHSVNGRRAGRHFALLFRRDSVSLTLHDLHRESPVDFGVFFS